MGARLAVESLSFSYETSTGSLEVLQDVSLTLESGQVLIVMGPNGSGKSTLLRCMAGLLQPARGKVSLDGRDLSSIRSNRLARRLGYVSQSATSAFPFRARDVVVMGRAPHLNTLAAPSAADVHIALEAMSDMGIAHLADRSCHELSGGEWQLVLLARALAQRPDVLLLDEPTSHLDLGNQVRILGHIRRLASAGMAVALASHNPDQAFLAADCVAVLERRRLAAAGRPRDVLTAELLRRIYGVEVKVIEVPGGRERMTCVPVSME